MYGVKHDYQETTFRGLITQELCMPHRGYSNPVFERRDDFNDWYCARHCLKYEQLADWLDASIRGDYLNSMIYAEARAAWKATTNDPAQ